MRVVFLIMANLVIFAFLLVVSVIVIPLNMARLAYRKESVSDYLFTLILGQDQIGGSALYGTEDFTISSTTYYLHSKKNRYATCFMNFINGLAYGFVLLFYWSDDRKEVLDIQKNHCKNSYYKELEELRIKSNIGGVNEK
jgi:hypothetical protein